MLFQLHIAEVDSLAEMPNSQVLDLYAVGEYSSIADESADVNYPPVGGTGFDALSMVALAEWS